MLCSACTVILLIGYPKNNSNISRHVSGSSSAAENKNASCKFNCSNFFLAIWYPPGKYDTKAICLCVYYNGYKANLQLLKALKLYNFAKYKYIKYKIKIKITVQQVCAFSVRPIRSRYF